MKQKWSHSSSRALDQSRSIKAARMRTNELDGIGDELFGSYDEGIAIITTTTNNPSSSYDEGIATISFLLDFKKENR